jgi:ABC-2 type transport system ATP-binding protein
VLELTVPEADRAQTLQALGTLRAEDPANDRHHGRIVVPAPHGSATLAKALRRLHAAGVTLEDVALHKPTLDDVFLALTGQLATTPSGNGHDTPGGGDRRGRHRHERATR